MPFANVPTEVNHIFEAAEKAYLEEHPNDKEGAARVGWSVVKNHGWKKNRQGEWRKTRKARFMEDVNSIIYEFVSKRKDVNPKEGKEKYGDVNFADEKNKKYPLNTKAHVKAAASYFGMSKNRSKYSSADQKKIDAKISAAKKKFGIGKENKEMSERINIKEFAMIPVKDTPVFRAGKYTHENKDGKKITTTFTEDNLDEMVRNYNAETPVVFIPGHTSDHAVESAIPKLGFIGGLKRVGKELIATGVQFTDKLVDAIKEGFYDDRSIETYQDENGWNLYRIGILGAAPPKVKGLIPLLDSIQMSEPPKNLLSFQVDALALEEMETAAEDDTLKNIEEEFATCLSDIENHLAAEDEPDEVKQNCLSAMMECYSNVIEEICKHFTFLGKLEQLEPEEKEEMMEKISGKLKQLFHIGTKQSQTNSKESDMDAKELKEFQEKQKALELQQTSLDEATKKLEAQKLEFAEKEKVLKVAEQKKADEAIEAKLVTFKEQLIAKKYPVKKMEDAGIFILAKKLLSAQPLEFADGKKEPFAVLESLITNFAPIQTGIVEMKDEEVKNVTELAKKYNLSGAVGKESLARIEFCDKYVTKNFATIPGESEKEKIAFVMTKIMTRELDYTKGV